MVNKFFKSFLAVAAVLGSALGFVACQEDVDDVVANPTVELSTSSLNFTKTSLGLELPVGGPIIPFSSSISIIVAALL